jgi:RHS repeat-associated protein
VTDASGVTTYNYDAVGNLGGYVYPNGVATSYAYDGQNRLVQMGSAKGGALASYSYSLGPAGNRLTVAELSGRTVGYGYDALYRLTRETVTADPNNHNGTASYTYDAVGNRTMLSSTLPPAGGTSYSYDADDRLASDSYDANGNTVLSGGVSDSYDFENHLTQHGAVTIVYDGDGNRVAETVGGVTTQYLVDTQNPTGYAQVVDESQSGTVTRSYSYGLERISESQTISGTPTTSFYGYDGHSSVRQLTNSAGAVTDSYDYDAFGNLINSSGTTPNVYLFAAEAYDSALGLYYNRARYLNTTTGRFWSMDTVEGSDSDPASLHKYLYAGANPINRIDPSGHDSIAELDISSAISETLDAISGIQQITRIKNQISSVLDLLSAVVDLGILFESGGGASIINLAKSIESGATDELGREFLESPLELFASVGQNAERIAQANLTSISKVAKLTAAFEAEDSTVLLYLPGFIGSLVSGPISSGLEVAGRPLKLTTQGGFSLLGMGFQGGGTGPIQIFHVDLVSPLKLGHSGTAGGDLDAWYDGILNYQVPQQ